MFWLLLLNVVSLQLLNFVFMFHIFKGFLLSGPSVLLSGSINMQGQDENQQSLSLTSEDWGLFLLVPAEEGPCYSGNSHPRHELTGPLFSEACLDKVISDFFWFLVTRFSMYFLYSIFYKREGSLYLSISALTSDLHPIRTHIDGNETTSSQPSAQH